jgi:hypothetical protein
MPELVELRPELEKDGVRVVAVALDLALPESVASAEKLAAFVERRGIALPVLAFQGDYDALSERLDLPGGPPCTVLYGPAGELGRIEGALERDELAALVARARRADEGASNR